MKSRSPIGRVYGIAVDFGSSRSLRPSRVKTTSADGVCTIGMSREPVRMVALKFGRLNSRPESSKKATWSEKYSPVAEYSYPNPPG
jgi:hypothetical protein